MIDLFVQIDRRPLSRWWCDAVICATPTGSTAYAYSAGGPVVWPEVDALVLLPLAAHALFSKPMVVSPHSEIAIDLESDSADLNAD
jgi:NAD+ kinase